MSNGHFLSLGCFVQICEYSASLPLTTLSLF
uniref:Uncharacterized protein n=1 Tax=Arundo donax TaxID=35708 RepID=A0A0A8YHF8_ARUDO